MHLSAHAEFLSMDRTSSSEHFGAGLFTDVEITYPATERSLAGLDQIKNPNYSEAEGRCEMFERSSEGMHLS
jgi:hypothetical protein